MSKYSWLLILGFLFASPVSARGAVSGSDSEKCVPAPPPAERPDVRQNNPDPIISEVGIDLHRLATFFENCRLDCRCADGLKEFFRDRFGIEIEALPDPWSGESDRSDETGKLLAIAAELWAYVEDSIDWDPASIHVVHSTPTRLFFLAETENAKAVHTAVDNARQRIIDSIPNGDSEGSSEESREKLVTYLERSFNLYAAPGIRTPVPVAATAPHRDFDPTIVESLPDDPILWAQWGLERTGILQAWGAGHTGSRPVKVALLDSGIDPSQRDLESSGWHRYRFCTKELEPDCDPEDTADPAGHGTALAGILAATAENGTRVAGVHHRVELLNLKVMDQVEGGTARGSVVDAVRAFKEAADRSSVVALVAWGQSEYSPALWEAILRARAADVLVVTGAGNDQFDLDGADRFFPASFRAPEFCQPECPCLDNLIAVGATKLALDERDSLIDKKASFSNHGSEVVELGAPGVGIVTLSLSDRFGGVIDASGTSVAAAMVAGAAALVAESLPTSPPPTDRFFTIRSRLLRGADRVAILCDHFAQGRRLNVYNAVNNTSMDDLRLCTDVESP